MVADDSCRASENTLEKRRILLRKAAGSQITHTSNFERVVVTTNTETFLIRGAIGMIFF